MVAMSIRRRGYRKQVAAKLRPVFPERQRSYHINGAARHVPAHAPIPYHGCPADGVLSDQDWRDAEGHLDADPQASRRMKEWLGIDNAYYVAVPADPADEEMKGMSATLRALTHGGS